THTSPTSFYPLSLHDALPICFRAIAQLRLVTAKSEPRIFHHRRQQRVFEDVQLGQQMIKLEDKSDFAVSNLRAAGGGQRPDLAIDRKSTRLNSSHSQISYAVF